MTCNKVKEKDFIVIVMKKKKCRPENNVTKIELKIVKLDGK